MAEPTTHGRASAPSSGASWTWPLAVLIIISQLGIVALNGTYVRIGLMIGAGAALVVGGMLSARRRDNKPTTGSLEPWKNSSALSGGSA